MKTTPSVTNTTAKWRHVMIRSCTYRNRGMNPGGIDAVTIPSIHAKSFTPTTKGHPTRRGVPPH